MSSPHRLETHNACPAQPGNYEFFESIDIRSTPLECFTALLQFKDYERWFTPILDARVLKLDADGKPSLVDISLDMRFRTINYQLAYQYSCPTQVRWQLAGGDLKGVRGMYLLEEVDAGTRATCFQSIDLGFRVPVMLRRFFEVRALRMAVTEFRNAVESRA